MIEGFAPAPDPIVLVSPTTANSLLACPLRAAFARDSRLRQLAARPKPEAILGSASHALAEAVANGDFDDMPETERDLAIAARWDEFVANQRVRLEAALLLGPVPAPARWPFYEVKRAAALALAAELLGARRARAAAPRAAAWIEAEVELASEEPPLVGRIDRVEHTEQGVRIIDLKSNFPSLIGDLDPAHEVQLLLYAALYRGATGEPPYEIGIQYFNGQRVTRAVDWQRVDELVKDVLDARSKVNQLTERRTGAWETLARPSPETCLFCEYQPVCAPFLEGVGPLLPRYAAGVVGQVIDCVNTVHGVRFTVLSELASASESRPVIAVLDFPAALAPKRGDRVSVCWAIRDPRGTDLRVNWLSALHVWEKGPAGRRESTGG